MISMNPHGPFVCCEREQVQDTVKVGSVLIDVETGDSSAPTPTPPKPEPTPAPVKDAKDGASRFFQLFFGVSSFGLFCLAQEPSPTPKAPASASATKADGLKEFEKFHRFACLFESLTL